MSDVTLWLIVCAILGAAYLIARSFDQRATKDINEQTNAALLNSGDWRDGDDLDQAIGITRDGSHDGGELSTQEEFEWLEITREFYREAS